MKNDDTKNNDVCLWTLSEGARQSDNQIRMCLWGYIIYPWFLKSWLLTFEILKYEYILCEEYNLVFRYKIHYKNMSSDWAKNLGMCLWRYYVPLIFEILKHEYLKINLQKHEYSEKSSDFQKSIFRCQ